MHQQYDNKLSVGDLCLIIGTSKPENSFMIGRTVVVECILQPGDYVPEQYGGIFSNHHPLNEAGTIISGDICKSLSSMRDGYGLIQSKYLLPIKPMKDDELSFEEIGKLTVKAG